MMKASDCISNIGNMLKSMVKIVLQSRPVSIKRQISGTAVTIMGNGPSLRDTIAGYGTKLRQSDTMAVNFAANAGEFCDLQPRYYILADPHFFLNTSDANVQRLYRSLNAVNWQLTLLVPRKYIGNASALIENPKIKVMSFNFIGLQGPAWFERLCYNLRLGMPRPRNVLIPAIMCAIWLGYDEIKLAGADHSWLQSIWVNDNNEVVSVQPHFYKEDKKEERRVRSEYTNYRLHQILYSFYVAFRSYFDVQRYAVSRHVKIINTTPGSYIDAFPRGNL